MTPIEKDKLEALCNKYGLSELGISKGIYMADDNSGITVNLRGDLPVVGVTIAGTIHTEGHGNLKVPDIQAEINTIMKSKKSRSPVSEQVQSAVVTPQTKDAIFPKLGTGDTPAKGTTTATCAGCSCKISGSVDEFAKVQGEYGQIYCQVCIVKADGKPKPQPQPVKPSEPKVEVKPSKPVVIRTCKTCGIELSGARALECYQKDKPFTCEEHEKEHTETKDAKDAKAEEHKARPEEPKIKEKIMSEELTTTKPGANVPAKKTDQERDDEIELAKAERFLKNQGSSYSVSGKNRPDSAMVQKFANTVGISSEIIFAEQTKDYAHVVVRGHRGANYVDAVVHHDFETELQLQTMEIIKKNPEILDHYEGLLPVIKEGAKIESGNKVVDAKYYLIHALLSFKTFSLRDATTKAMSIAQMKLLNQDAREPEEVASEQKERDLVEEKRNQKR